MVNHVVSGSACLNVASLLAQQFPSRKICEQIIIKPRITESETGVIITNPQYIPKNNIHLNGERGPRDRVLYENFCKFFVFF